jgi:tripartite-type tricarboxylate transporter receptor subunit TctC
LRLITPAPPGGTTDLLARLLGPHLSQALGRPVIVDNRGGGGGVVAAEYSSP